MLKDQTHTWKSEGDQELPTEPIARKEIAPAQKKHSKELGNEAVSGQEWLENTQQLLLQGRETAHNWDREGDVHTPAWGWQGKLFTGKLKPKKCWFFLIS